MAEQRQKIVWAPVLISALLTALLSLAVGIGIFHYTSKAPELNYTTFPVSGFRATNKSLTIYNVQIENSGNKEAEDVQVIFTFPSGANVTDYNLEPSAKTIKYSISDTNDMTNAVFNFPLLNPTESCKFSFLAENAKTGNVEVDLRGKGTIGEIHKIKSERPLLTVIITTIVVMSLILAIIVARITSKYSKIAMSQTTMLMKLLNEQSESSSSQKLPKEV